jgi:MATE family multidrug resistance protein
MRSTPWIRVTIGTVVVLVALFIGGGVLRGAGDSRTPMRVTALANLLNVVLAYALIYGHFGLPALGAVGSGTQRVPGDFPGALAGAGAAGSCAVARERRRVDPRLGRLAPEPGGRDQLLKIGVPAALEQVLIAAAFVTLAIVVAHLSTVTLAAHQIAIVALSFSFLPGIGFGVAATTLVGQSVGARRMDEGALAVRIATRWAVGWMSAIGAIVLICARPIMQLFTIDPAVVEAGAAGLRVVALAQPFWAVLFVLAGALRGTGNTRFPLIATGGTVWLAVGLACALLAIVGGGLVAVWAAFLALAPAMAAIYGWRWRRAVAECGARAS